MESLAAALASCGSLLAIDAAGQPVHVALFRADAAPVAHRSNREAGVGLFEAVEAIVRQTGWGPGEVGGFVYDEGPGSQLGLRTAAMAIRTWQTLGPAPRPVFVYRSLALAAAALPASVPRPVALALDARREAWHAVRIAADGTTSEVVRVPAAELAAWPEPLATLAGFRAWSPPPRPWIECPYDPASALAICAQVPLLARNLAPAPWHSLPPDYRPWSGDRHRAPRAANTSALR